MKAGARPGALEGLAIGIRTRASSPAKPTSFGSLITRFGADDDIRQRTHSEAGAIDACRTATPEFSCASVTIPDSGASPGIHGIPSSPRAVRPGGSGASLAAGTSTLAMGSDIGGSIRIPASCTGVVGYKPPYGRNADDAPFNLDPIAHRADDAFGGGCHPAAERHLRPSPHDIASLRPRLTLPSDYKPIKGWRIAIPWISTCFEVDKKWWQYQAALDVFHSLGATGA